MKRLCLCIFVFAVGSVLAVPRTSVPDREKKRPFQDDAAPAIQEPAADPRAEDVKELLELLKKRKFKELEETARRLTGIAPAEARFHYLRAEALAGLGKMQEADALRESALQLNPQDETAHALAGDMLYDMGRSPWNKREWRKVLDLPPATGLNEANAHIELGWILAAESASAEAANHLEMALELFRQAKAAGLSIELDGAQENDLGAKIRQLRKEANAADPQTGKMTIHINISVKDDKGKEMARAIKEAEYKVEMTVQPAGVRVLDEPAMKLRYDPKTEHIFLNATPLGKQRLKLLAEQTRLAIFAGDCCYIYRVHRESGRMEQLARYERDYVLKFIPNGPLRELKNVSVKLNDKVDNWNHLQEGVPFDILPESLKLDIEGTDASNQRCRESITLAVPFKESDLPTECRGCEKCQPGFRKPQLKPPPKTPAFPTQPNAGGCIL
ncbi:MAG: hypothetical protein HY360_22630 [Verrucomicrobia bacterium]|nr:hypothetical protein [Verrucomicrobiota bacterium]